MLITTEIILTHHMFPLKQARIAGSTLEVNEAIFGGFKNGNVKLGIW